MVIGMWRPIHVLISFKLGYKTIFLLHSHLGLEGGEWREGSAGEEDAAYPMSLQLLHGVAGAEAPVAERAAGLLRLRAPHIRSFLLVLRHVVLDMHLHINTM